MNHSRRNFLSASLGVSASTVLPLLAQEDAPEKRFHIGIQEYTFHSWLASGKLDHLDYPKLVRDKLGLQHIEYWNRPFEGKHTDKNYVGELVKRTVNEGMENVLILVDIRKQLDAKKVKDRDLSVDEHKGWIDCAHQLGCKAIRVNCHSGGDPDDNLEQMADGVGRLCDYAKDSKVKVVIEPHGANSQDPDWLLKAIKMLDRENAGLLPDFNNFGSFDRYEAVKNTLPHAVAVCAKAKGFNELGNENSTDYHRMLKIVHESSFKGVITIEFEGRNVDPIEGALKTKELILRSLEKASE